MADFLSRLAGRTLGVLPVVRPFIPPAFAPGAALPEADMRPTLARAPAPALSQPAINYVDSPLPPQAHTPSTLHPPEQQLHPTTPSSAQAEIAAGQPPNGDPHLAPAAAAAMEEHVAGAPTSEQAVIHPPPAKSEPGPARSTSVQRDLPAPGELSEQPARMELAPAELPAHPALVPAITEAQFGRSPTHPAPVLIERGVAAASPPPATIKVSIGRIDVRAVTSPAKLPAGTAPQRTGTPTPGISLEEYLRVRNGKER